SARPRSARGPSASCTGYRWSAHRERAPSTMSTLVLCRGPERTSPARCSRSLLTSAHGCTIRSLVCFRVLRESVERRCEGPRQQRADLLLVLRSERVGERHDDRVLVVLSRRPPKADLEPQHLEARVLRQGRYECA